MLIRPVASKFSLSILQLCLQGDFDADQIKTNVLASLEAERQKLAKEVERMQRRRACISKCCWQNTKFQMQYPVP